MRRHVVARVSIRLGKDGLQVADDQAEDAPNKDKRQLVFLKDGVQHLLELGLVTRRGAAARGGARRVTVLTS